MSRILVFLIDAVAAFFVYLLLARFHFQWLRVPFRNQVGEFVIATTSWIVAPARRLIPTLAGLDLATLMAAWLLQAAALYLQVVIRSWDLADATAHSLLLIVAVAAVDLVRYSIHILIFAVFVQALLSWVNTDSPLSLVLNALTRPFLRPLRRLVPPVANVDLSPAILILVLIVLLMAIAELSRFALR